MPIRTNFLPPPSEEIPVCNRVLSGCQRLDVKQISTRFVFTAVVKLMTRRNGSDKALIEENVNIMIAPLEVEPAVSLHRAPRPDHTTIRLNFQALKE